MTIDIVLIGIPLLLTCECGIVFESSNRYCLAVGCLNFREVYAVNLSLYKAVRFSVLCDPTQNMCGR